MFADLGNGAAADRRGARSNRAGNGKPYAPPPVIVTAGVAGGDTVTLTLPWPTLPANR